jgi:hypothetical protein
VGALPTQQLYCMVCLAAGDPLKAVLDDGARDDLVVPSAGATRIARSFRTQVGSFNTHTTSSLPIVMGAMAFDAGACSEQLPPVLLRLYHTDHYQCCC